MAGAYGSLVKDISCGANIFKHTARTAGDHALINIDALGADLVLQREIDFAAELRLCGGFHILLPWLLMEEECI